MNFLPPCRPFFSFPSSPLFLACFAWPISSSTGCFSLSHSGRISVLPGPSSRGVGATRVDSEIIFTPPGLGKGSSPSSAHLLSDIIRFGTGRRLVQSTSRVVSSSALLAHLLYFLQASYSVANLAFLVSISTRTYFQAWPYFFPFIFIFVTSSTPSAVWN